VFSLRFMMLLLKSKSAFLPMSAEMPKLREAHRGQEFFAQQLPGRHRYSQTMAKTDTSGNETNTALITFSTYCCA